MATEEHNIWHHGAYADKLARHFSGEEYSWLIEMLRKGCDVGPRGGGCTIYIVDHEDDQATTTTYDIGRDTVVDTAFMGVLQKPSSGNGLRFVVVAYDELYGLNFSYIDYMASVLNLEASFLFSHFERVRARIGPWYRTRAPTLLPSDAKHLEFVFPSWRYGYGHMAVTQSRPSTTHGRVSKS